MSACGRKGPSGFSARSTAEQVTQGVDAYGLTAIVTDAGRAVKESIMKKSPGAKIDVMELDLNSMASVRKFASDYISSGLPLNILINNAGVLTLASKVSKDNIELQFATNHLGHFLLTNLLLETMKKTVQESNREGRIVNVSSSAHHWFKPKHFQNHNNDIWMSYKGSKLANILHANELARRFKEEGVEITANSVHPGSISTNIFLKKSCLKDVLASIAKPLLKNTQQGAATSCYVALNEQVKGVSGQYFVDCNLAKASSYAYNSELAQKLWDYSSSLITTN